MQDEKNNLQVLYLQGRPSAHAIHAMFARSVTQEFRFIDEKWRWQDKNYPGPVNLLAWFYNALFFKHKRKYDIFLVDNLHLTPIIMRKLGLIRKKQKLVVHLGSHTLYFMYAKRFGRFNLYLHKLALKNYDALICEGEMAKDLVKKILGDKHPPVYVNTLGPLKYRLEVLNHVTPQLESKKIMMVINGPTEFRSFYKGLDLGINGFIKALENDSQLYLHIIGDWEKNIRDSFYKNIPAHLHSHLVFEGRFENYEQHISSYALCLHCARGDAFPTSTIETMAAGIPTMVSEWTGTREIVARVNNNLITTLEPVNIAEKISWYFSLSPEERKNISDEGRLVVKDYNCEDSAEAYKKIFEQVKTDLGFAK